MAKKSDKFKLIIAVIVCCVASSLGRVAYIKINKTITNKSSSRTRIINADDKQYVISDKQNRFNIKVKDKTSDSDHEYNIGMADSAEKLKPMVKTLTAEQKNYQIKNKELISQASMAYAFIVANDYKLVRFCSKYHPVTKLKNKFDSHFKDKKIKAENILNTAFGKSGAKNFEYAIMSNPDMIKTQEQQIEDDYQSVRVMAAQYGVKNFSRKQYCQMFDDDDAISFAIEADDKKFKTLLPNF